MSEITSETCSHDCSSCKAACASRQAQSQPQFEPLYDDAKVRHVIGVVSGKGGVGKSLVTSLLACAMQRRGYRTAVLDADLTGPSIPRAFGVTEKAEGGVACLYPSVSAGGTQIMSMNLLLDNDTDPVIWRLLTVLFSAFYGVGIIIYIVMAIILPEARTPEQLLQMEGKAVTPQHLADIVVDKDQSTNHQPNLFRSALAWRARISGASP